ncbi:ParB N-terminal domain-containing protein [Sphaerisporangium sp. B11E5]|uniref:ParB/RepB/Spo0J family partition protein n=1 Tax=Sphaerisporangium sp. B11E5 TaxID=3153563 RepID=UPI00325CD8ED
MTLDLRSLTIHEESEAVPVPLDSLTTAGSPRIGGEDPEHLRLLVATENRLPPIVVHRPTMRVIDGRHRVAAARERGQETIEARFFDGSEDDAFVLAVTLNIGHGLPLTLRERTAAAARIVGTHPHWSDRVIASIAGISARTVAGLRAKVGGAAARGQVRLGRDGRAWPVDGTEGRRVAAEFIERQPELSLRQIAQLAGISPETARDVRNRLSRGLSPIPDRGRRGRPEPEQPAPPARQKRAGEAAEPPDSRSLLVQRLQSDPQFRNSPGGRALLRLLLSHTPEANNWERLAEGIPAHRSSTVARLALECSRIWEEFADRIEHTKVG